jgi:hypothetical protein
MAYAPERERWFTFRSERLRIFMEAWLSAHALNPIARPMWVPEAPSSRTETPSGAPPALVVAPAASLAEATRDEPREPRRGKSAETLRRNLREISDALGPRDLDTLTAFAEFLKARRAARSLGQQQHYAEHHGVTDEEEAPASQEVRSDVHSDIA